LDERALERALPLKFWRIRATNRIKWNCLARHPFLNTEAFASRTKPLAQSTRLNIIDTPGLKEVKAIGDLAARGDDEIIDTINFCLKNEVTKINTLLIFISFELGVTQDDVDSFDQFLSRFGHPDIQIILCVTRAESKTAAWKADIENQLTQHSYFAKVLEKHTNCKICFLGCVDTVNNDSVSSIDDLRGLYATVYELRKVLLLNIFSAEKQVKLTELPMLKTTTEKLRTIFRQQDALLTQLLECGDFTLDTAELKVDNFVQLVKSLAEKPTYSGILLDEEFQGEWIKVIRKIGKIEEAGKMPQNLLFKLKDAMNNDTKKAATSAKPATPVKPAEAVSPPTTPRPAEMPVVSEKNNLSSALASGLPTN